MILASNIVLPPAIQATRSKENNPTSPQLIPPMMDSARAILFTIIIYMTKPLFIIVWVNYPGYILSHKKQNIHYSSKWGMLLPNSILNFSKARFSILDT